ncbi:MAG: hypothetical protein JKX95_08190 [Bacteroidia bacterium]|nr:hypothetical protein [Bacteroidia bacterium]
MTSELKKIKEIIIWYRNNESAMVGLNKNEINNFSTEPETVTFIVLPLLRILGWQEKNIMLEFHLKDKKKKNKEKKKIDILLCNDPLRNKPKVIY